MMMRADEGYTPVEGCTAEELLACLVADDMDACIAECGNGSDEEEDTPVKSGTLKVTVSANNGAKAIIGGTSDLDTINFSASEAGISVDKIVLERYGYSEAGNIEVWLEDANGTKVTNEKTINSKDEVSLTVKSAYREMDKTDSFIIVTSIPTGTTGGTIGFKVKEVSASAEKVTLANYTPTTYDMVIYNGSTATVAYKGNSSTYHYAEGEKYDVARIKITAGSSAISVNGFKLTNDGSLSLNRYVDSSDVEVKVNDEKIASTISVTRDNEIEISFKNAQTIDAKKNTIFVVSLGLDNLDDFGKTVKLETSNTDVRGTEDKTNTRVTFDLTSAGTAPTYTFNGGQIKLTSKKLGTIDAAAGAERVVFAEGTIETNDQIINLANFTLTTTKTGVESMEILLNGAVIGDATADTVNKTGFTFKGVTIDKSGKLQFAVTMDSEAANDFSVTQGSFNKTQFYGAKYDESNQTVSSNDVLGSITFSAVKVQAARGSLTNNITKSVEYLTSQTSKQVVFDGTYTAKKGNVYLNEVTLSGNALKTGDSVTFYLSINGNDVASINVYENQTGDTISFSNVLVEKGKEVAVKLEAETYAALTGNYTYNLALNGEDVDGIGAGSANADTVEMKFVDQGGVKVTLADASDTVLMKANNIKLANFTVKPSKTEGTTMDSVDFNLSGSFSTGNVVVKVDGSELDEENIVRSSATGCTLTGLAESLDSDGVVVEISYRGELGTGDYATTIVKVNDTNVNKTINKKVVDALVTVTKQENLGDTTKFTFGVETYDDDVEVLTLTLSGSSHNFTINNVIDGDTYEVENGTTADFITTIKINSTTIDKTTYKDFFKVGSEYVKVFKARD